MTTRTVGAGHGWKWIVQGVNVGRANPRAVYGATAVVALLALAPNVLQAVLQIAFRLEPETQIMVIGATSLVSIILYPLLIGGVLRVIDAVEHGRPAAPGDVFSTFTGGQAGRFIGFGVLMGALYIVTFYALVSAFGEGVLDWYMDVLSISQEMSTESAPASPPEMPMPPAGIGPLMALGIFFGVYYATVYAVGLGQVALGGRPVMQAFTDGLGGALRNVLPVIVAAAIAMAGGFALMLAFAMVVTIITVVSSLVHPALAALLVLPLYLVLLLVLYIVMFGAMYAIWRDVCGPQDAVDRTAPGNDGGAGHDGSRIEL
ncbi:hypothetical protein CNR27_01825 [Luteimonas chenhongjianii]|uniref:Uncharacterized protein n=1 Tax=Luteimonas chenhongjianii TaxID=2006110 RepID=A0A290XB41_9GAMM|nr:hypothetical protein [Luteimonas chenhongjianii]ATD66340.1 hypothetical protein CNR27_01825 [Luteimonas chenhongjianii]